MASGYLGVPGPTAASRATEGHRKELATTIALSSAAACCPEVRRRRESATSIRVKVRRDFSFLPAFFSPEEKAAVLLLSIFDTGAGGQFD